MAILLGIDGQHNNNDSIQIWKKVGCLKDSFAQEGHPAAGYPGRIQLIISYFSLLIFTPFFPSGCFVNILSIGKK